MTIMFELDDENSVSEHCGANSNKALFQDMSEHQNILANPGCRSLSAPSQVSCDSLSIDSPSEDNNHLVIP